MNSPPDGIVTFLFTDIEGSTMLAQKFPDSLPAALIRHHEILQKTIEANNGYVFEIIGDAFCASFSNASDAVSAACDIQRSLIKEDWGETPIKVRIGINTGEANWNGKGYTGYMTLSRTQRIMSAAYGEQIIISNEAYNEIKEISQNEFSFRDMGERRLKSLIRPEHLYQVLAEGLQSEFPPLKTLDARPNNLPVQTTSFIGRTKEMAEIKQQLPGAHLLSLVGPGGTGKTRIALQTGADMIDDFPHGVWFVELAPLSDPSLVVQEISSVFNLKESGESKLIDILNDYLKEKELLLIIDNCEHLINECAKVSEIITRKCPKVKIIATSRETLRIEGEKIFRIPSLTVPDIKEKYTVESLSEFESVKLFTERALSVKPEFIITNDNAPSIAQICSQLDGIPYALELAAARIRSLPAGKIAERLGDRFHLLTDSSRTALPKQQTLHAMIDWSYDLLNEREKAILARLSVFAGGCTLESAENVCSGNGVEDFEILNLLSSLSDKSLVFFNEVKDRYNLLETVREYSKEKLIEKNEEEGYNTKHLQFFLKLAEEIEPNLTAVEPQSWLNRLEDEHDNLRNALKWSLKGNKNLKGGQRLAGALRQFWVLHGYFSEGTKWINKMLDRGNEDKIMRGKLLKGAGILAVRKGDISFAKKSLDEALHIYRDTDDKANIATVLDNLGIIYNEQGEYSKSKILFEEALNIHKKFNDKLGLANSFNNLGTIAHFQSNFTESKSWYTQALKIYREIGDKHDIGTTLLNLGNLPLLNKEDYIKSQEWFEEALSIFQGTGDKFGIANSLGSLGNLEIFQCNYEDARKHHGKALDILYEIENKSGIAFELADLGEIAFIQKDYPIASKYLQEALLISRELENKYILAEILNNLGNLSQENGNYNDAWQYYEEALVIRKSIQDKSNIIQSLYAIGNFNFATGCIDKAAKLLGAADALLELIVSPLPPYQIERYNKTVAGIKYQLGDDEFKKTWKEGKSLSTEQAIELALEK